MPRDARAPELPEHRFAAWIEVAQLERRLVFGRVAREHIVCRPARVRDDDVNRSAQGVSDPARGIRRREPGHASALGEEIRDENDGAL